MSKRLIVAYKDKEVLTDTSLTKLCKQNTNFNYGYLKSKKYPFTYKGWQFEKRKI